MKKTILYSITLLSFIPLTSCQYKQNVKFDIDNKSYINAFELLHENPNNYNKIIINSPRAVINPMNNDIEIYESSIQILNSGAEDLQIKSGNSILDNSNNIIRIFNKVNISLLEENDSYLITDSLIWNLNSSKINLDNPLEINIKNSKVSSSNGIYNINSGILNINDNIFYKDIYSKKGEKEYQIKIISDNAKWFKNDNSIEFSSDNNQVETTIDFLSIK